MRPPFLQAIVVVAARGAYAGKPRPAMVVQSDLFNPTHASVTICPITSDCVDAPLFRITLPPGPPAEATVSNPSPLPQARSALEAQIR